MATFVSVYENVQKNFGEYTYPISRTGKIQMMQPSPPGVDVTTYENGPTCNGVIVPQWYASVTSSLDTRTSLWDRYAYQTNQRMQGKALTNCSESGADSLLMVSLTLGVTSSAFPDRLRIRHGW